MLCGVSTLGQSQAHFLHCSKKREIGTERERDTERERERERERDRERQRDTEREREREREREERETKKHIDLWNGRQLQPRSNHLSDSRETKKNTCPSGCNKTHE